MLILWTPDENKDLFKLTKDVPADLKVVRHSNTSALPPTKEGDVVLAMGGEVRDTLESLKLIPKKRTIGALRPPKSIKLPTGGTLLVTYSMAVGAVNYELGVQARIDFNMAVRLATTGSLAPKLGHYRWVPRFSEAIEGIREKYAKTGQPVDVALDLETIGLSPYAEKVWILTIQVAWKKGHADIVYIPSLEYQNKLRAKAGTVESTVLDDVRWLLTTEMVSLRGANLKFDLNWIKVHYGFDCTNFKFDTMIVGSLLDENRGSSLNLHTKWYCPDLGGYDDHLNAKYDKSRMDLIPKDELLPYAAGDADACLRVADTMKKELLSDPPLARFYVKILHPAARAYEHVERTGLLIDVPYYLEFENELEAEIERLEKQAFKIMGGRICAKHKDKLSLTRAAVLKEFMFGPLGLNLKPKMLTGKTAEPSTSMDHLMMFATDPAAKEFIDVVNEWAVARKMLSTYVCKRDEDGNVIGGFLSHMQPDCRFHPTYFFHNSADGEGGTNTGRLSARDPAIQCQRGSSLIYCKDGLRTIKSMVEGFEGGQSYWVKSHTGQWRRVVGVYRNGVRPVYEVTTKSGKVTGCTANHPLLLAEGFVRTDQTTVGDLVFVDGDWNGPSTQARSDRESIFQVHGSSKSSRKKGRVALPVFLRRRENHFWASPSSWAGKILRVLAKGTSNLAWVWPKGIFAHLSTVGGDASSGARNHRQSGRLDLVPRGRRRLSLGGFSELSLRYGRVPTGNVLGPAQWAEGVLQGKLPLGNTQNSGPQSNNESPNYVQWADAVRGRMGGDYRSGWEFVFPPTERVDRGGGFVDAQRAAQAGFVLDPIVSIRYIGEEETFDLTVEVDHSFVSDGMVVHNTVPKHSKWAKKLRKAFIAPPGMLILSNDYSQGELKITACLADEDTMIEAYLKGLDLHAITAGSIVGMDLDEIMALKETHPDKYDELRQLGKAGNFGLCIAEGQLVLTNKGLVPIEKVTTQHKVWDGVEWVPHQGLLFKGYREVITYQGLTATPDHEVWTIEGGKVPIGTAASKGYQLVRTGEGPVPVVAPGFEAQVGNPATGGALQESGRRVFGVRKDQGLLRGQPPVRAQQGLFLHEASKVFRSKVENLGHAVRRYGSAVRQRYARFLASIQGAGHQDAVPVPGGVREVGLSGVPEYGLQGAGLRQDRQQRPLQPGKLEAGFTFREPQKQVVRVYDLYNAGPRHRFTCSNVLVSNCYGMGAEGFQEYARIAYRVNLSLEQAHDARDKFFKTYPKLLKWHAKYKAMAKQWGYIRSPLGRVRHLPLINSRDRQSASKDERRAVNAPVQSTLSDMSLWATARAHENGWTKEAPVVAMVHDQLISYIPEDNWEFYAKRMKELMSSLPFNEVGWSPALPFTVDCEVGPNLGELKKQKHI